MPKIAVVTGANKGIGLAIVRGLCEKYKGKVYLTARDESRGNDAVHKLKELGFNPDFHQLDINDQRSINKFRDHIKETDGGIDILINNAAIVYSDNTIEPFSEQAEVTVQVNYFSVLHVCETLFPILRPNARVVNVSSVLGHLSKIPSPVLRSKLGSSTLTVEKLNELMNKFILAAKDGKHTDQGWGNSAYAVSKVGVCALTIIQQREFDNETKNRGILVNSVHPGYVNTDMTNHKGPLTVEEGAKAPLYLALEPHGLRGQYVWHDSTVANWFAPSPPGAY